MANITLAGTLRDPNGDLAVGDKIRFTHKSTTGETVKSASSILTIDPTGVYSVDLEYGLILVEYKDARNSQFKNLGVATVNGTNPATTIPELLNALVPVSSAELIEFQAILADCVAAKVAAEAAAATLDLVNDLSQAYIFDTVALFKDSLIVFPDGKTIHLNDRDADFTKITGTGTANGKNIISSTSLSASIKLPESGRPILEQYGVSASATATFNAEAIQLAANNGSGSFTSALSAVIPFDVPIVVTGSGGNISMTGDLSFSWVGSQTAEAWKFGDGVSNTRSMDISNFKINDASGGVDVLLHLHKIVQCQFYSLTMTANSAPIRGVGLKTTFAFLNDFFGVIITGFWDSWELGSDTNATTMYGLNIEGGQNDGINIPAGAETNRNMIIGGGLEGLVGSAAHISQPTKGLAFKGTYFEANGTDLLLDMVATNSIPVSLQDTRHTLNTGTAAIKITGLGRVIAERPIYSTVELFDVTNVSGWVKVTDSVNEGPVVEEFTPASVGKLVSVRTDGDSIRYRKLRTLELAGFRVPVMQTGTIELLVGTGTVTFPAAFANAPKMVTQIISEHTLGTVANVIALPSSTTAATFRNRGSETVTIQWFAFDIGNLN